MLTKEMVYTGLKDLPDQFELDDLIEKLIFIEKIKKGMEQIGEGKVKSHADVKKMVAKWREQRGQSRQ